MLDPIRLLVVDDEELICQACVRILAPRGFDIDCTVDPVEGLCWAVENDYGAILLDVKMAALDGIQFLWSLRRARHDVPVILITGYPNMHDAASALRLGAVDYLTKPFSPEQVVCAVHRALGRQLANGQRHRRTFSELVDASASVTGDYLFWAGSWLRAGDDGTVRVGVLPTSSQCKDLVSIRLPGIGEAAYQGLPLADLRTSALKEYAMPAPVSGVVAGVNERLLDRPSLLATDPLRAGWIACLCPMRPDEEVELCPIRRVVLANSEPASAEEQAATLRSLGCCVVKARDWRQLEPALVERDHSILIMDAASFDDEGPEVAQRVNHVAPTLKIVVLASPDSKWESAYRRQRIFYYALNPFSDNEIIDILDAAFPAPLVATRACHHPTASPRSIRTISITKGAGARVCLLAAPRLLRNDAGFGRDLICRLQERFFTVETSAGTDVAITPMGVVHAAESCDRLLVLMAKDIGRLPGTLVRDDFGRLANALCDDPGNVTTLIVQPPADDGGVRSFGPNTTTALAGHIANEMNTCYDTVSSHSPVVSFAAARMEL